ncbi:short-chain dehydrogenase/reductase family protein [Paecilomyces variotii No. 5]|uniref:Short-chain dehydrogenase/reductase family protein n=1 Tax=Byssochlamys spectabilis (strain No. 5 / NBRC 109023) TaxID=1356009 RepID=V5G8I3_BYSSN|nr:short-chain dehydrogenase/reductase family protein [Paecilomyces variotii No. 5]
MSAFIKLIKSRLNPPADPTSVSFAGKTVLLTGATSGLGFEAAIKFLNLGVANLIIGVQVWHLDMNNFQSVVEFAERARKEIPRLDIALLNAGLFHRAYNTSSDGWEETLQVNALSTALLALLLLPKLRASTSEAGPAHLTIVSSYQFTRVKAESLRTDGSLLKYLNDPKGFSGGKQYGISKLLLEYAIKNVASLTRNDDGTLQVIVNSVSPGFCGSSLGRQFNRFYERWATWLIYKLFARTPEEGSRSLVSATYQGVESHGKCWRSDGYLDESRTLTSGEEGERFKEKAWKEIVDILKHRTSEVEQIAGNISS